MEIKKNASNTDKDNDCIKIKIFMEEFKYSYGLFIDFITIGAKKGRIKLKQWFPEKYNQLILNKTSK